MSNIELPKHFLEDNPLNDISAALLTHFRMLTITMSELNEKVNKVVAPGMEKSRYDQYMAEKECRRYCVLHEKDQRSFK